MTKDSTTTPSPGSISSYLDFMVGMNTGIEVALAELADLSTDEELQSDEVQEVLAFVAYRIRLAQSRTCGSGTSG